VNEFIEQFLIESRELVAQAIDDLLGLEEQPDAQERLDSAFRAFHTLKGAAGIVDFDAMGRALHAAEDVLSLVRAGAEPVTPQLIGDSLSCLDQVVLWLDAMQVDGEIPSGADAAAEAVVRRFSRTFEQTPASISQPPAADWLADLLALYPQAAGQAVAALRFDPGPDALLAGEDPLAILAELPGLLALDIAPVAPWPSLETFEPFLCQLTFAALSTAPPSALRQALAAVHDRIQIRAVAGSDSASLSQIARELVEAQLLMLSDPAAEATVGRQASARAVAANVLRSQGRAADADRLGRTELDGLAIALQAVLDDSFAQGPADETPDRRTPQETATRALRVDVERVDALVNLTGELTVAKNALAHAAALAQGRHDPAELARLLKAQHGQLDRLVAELQRSVLNIRVLPMRQVFQRFPRVVRETVVSLGKPARLVTEGDNTEADKAIVESLFEPILHVLRNALDHGVEPAAVRAAAGKPPSATIWLRARREGGHVVIEVEDDGGGVDVARVRAVAAERGVAARAALEEMDDADVVDLVFAPGFSTATAVTALSGRGVGMDAVRSAVERIGGRVTLQSRPGQGATVRFTLPFTVMMSSVMTVEAGGQAFGIPMEAMAETLRLPPDRITSVGAARAFVWRGRTAPLINLAEALGERRVADGASDAHVVVTSVGGQVAGLDVDRIGERVDVMLKPLEGLLAGMRGVAGTTMLGDGRILLVLDVQALLQ
jgi:two-component system chemotaxis sensor kinase CheA